LPGRSGFDLIAELKHDPALRLIPVIVLSAYAAPEVIQKSYALGANCYIIKPGEFDALCGVIHMTVEYWFTVAVLCDPASPP
jgi:CheY-like chemotaxis protein